MISPSDALKTQIYGQVTLVQVEIEILRVQDLRTLFWVRRWSSPIDSRCSNRFGDPKLVSGSPIKSIKQTGQGSAQRRNGPTGTETKVDDRRSIEYENIQLSVDHPRQPRRSCGQLQKTQMLTNDVCDDDVTWGCKKGPPIRTSDRNPRRGWRRSL